MRPDASSQPDALTFVTPKSKWRAIWLAVRLQMILFTAIGPLIGWIYGAYFFTFAHAPGVCAAVGAAAGLAGAWLVWRSHPSRVLEYREGALAFRGGRPATIFLDELLLVRVDDEGKSARNLRVRFLAAGQVSRSLFLDVDEAFRLFEEVRTLCHDVVLVWPDGEVEVGEMSERTRKGLFAVARVWYAEAGIMLSIGVLGSLMCAVVIWHTVASRNALVQFQDWQSMIFFGALGISFLVLSALQFRAGRQMMRFAAHNEIASNDDIA